MSKRVPHVKIETFKPNNSETDRPIQIKLAPFTHLTKLSKNLKFGVEIRKKKIWSFLAGFPSKKSKLSFYAKKVCFQSKVTMLISNILPEVSKIKLPKVMAILIIFFLKIYANRLVFAFFVVNLGIYSVRARSEVQTYIQNCQ